MIPLELFKLLGTVAIDNSEANHGIDETTDKAEKAHPKISAAFEKIGDAAVKVGKVVATGLAAGATAMGKLISDSVSGYAEYEQLVGGVETLFKTSANKVQEYAANAFQTAGMSANEYMETVTSFSASLIQSLASHTSESYEASVEALDRHYEAVEDANEKALDLLKESQEQEVEAFEAATDAKIALIDKQYKENLKLIDEEKYNRLKAIDDQIEALNAQTEAERAAKEKKQQEDKIASLQEKINAAEDAEAKKKAEQNLANYLEELAQKEREAQRKEQIEALKDQKQVIKDEADAKKEAAKQQYEADVSAVKESSEAQLKELKKAQAAELKALKESNNEKLAEAKRYVAEQKAILESSAKTLEYTSETYDKAADYANKAIIDMSDNANKMGTSIEMIQNAYQGFAKQNYTMLDNLKLGYGGTQQEMERLLADAEKLTGMDYDISSFADIVEAIHAIQVEMGISGLTAEEAAEMVANGLMTQEEAFEAMGTTAKEGTSTIQGSITTMKAAWSNFITGMADENQDFDVLFGNLVNSLLSVADNLIPRIQAMLPRLVEGLNQLITTLLPYIPTIIDALLPGVIQGATALITGLVLALPQILQILLAQIPFVVSQLASALSVAFPALLQTVKELFGQIWDYIAVGLLGTEADFGTSMGKIGGFFEDLWQKAQYIWETVGQPVWDLIQDCIDIVSGIFAEKMPEIKGFVSSCFSDINVFWEKNLKPCLDAIGGFIKNTLAPIFKNVFETYIKGYVESAFNYIGGLWNDTLKPIFTGITDFLTGVFTGNWKQAFEGLVSIVKGIANNIINGIEFMINGAINALNGLIAGLNTAINLAGSLLGLNVSIPTIPLLNLPRLEEGGILEKGQVGLLEGKGAEAVVPLDQNRAWISAVARDMEGAVGGDSKQLQRVIDLLEMLIDMLPDTMKDAFASMKFDVNNREFARMVKAVN